MPRALATATSAGSAGPRTARVTPPGQRAIAGLRRRPDDDMVGERAGPQQLGDLLEVAGAGQLGDVVAAVADAGLVEHGDPGDDLDVDRRSRLDVPTSSAPEQGVEVGGGVQRRAAVDGDAALDQRPG